MREVLKGIKEGEGLGETQNGWGIKIGKNQYGYKCLNIGHFEEGKMNGEGIQIGEYGYMFEGSFLRDKRSQTLRRDNDGS